MNSNDRIARSLEMLRKADSEAIAEDRDGWDCAVAWDQLRADGVAESTMRELLNEGLVHQGVAEGQGRVRPVHSPGPVAGGRFLLTPAGLERARQARRAGPKPFWDEREKVLWFRKRPVKIYKQSAGSQKDLLRGFEMEGWQWCIADPLDPAAPVDKKKRLRNTTEALNRDQVNELLWFECDGDGGVRWWQRGPDGRPLRSGPEEAPMKRRRSSAWQAAAEEVESSLAPGGRSDGAAD